ncbi:MAG: hypothetical protein Q9215_005347 [Flavoplaca cf. flavocitrina]
MASHPEDNDAETSIAGHASSVHGQGASTPARRVLSTTWRGQNVEVTLPYPEHPIPRGDWWEPGDVSHYIYSTAPPKDPNFPRAFQHLPERDRHKRWTDINNPYVRIQKPTRPESQKSTMTGGPSLLGISKPRTSKRPSTYNESSRQSSLLDTDIGMEGWPVAGTSSSSGTRETKQEPNSEVKTETAMGQLLDVTEDNPKMPEANIEEKEAPKKSLLQQLYELQGLEAESVTTTTTTTTTITSIKTKPASATTSSEESMKEPTQTTPQVMTSISKDHKQTEEPVAAVPTDEPIVKTPVSDQHTPTTVTTHSAIYTPSSSTTAIPQPPSPASPPTALETLRSQELALETHTPLGTEISTWAAAGTVAAPPSSHYSSEAGVGEGGYIKRFTTRKNQVSSAEPNKDDAEPSQENAMVKWDPFGGLWGYAAKKAWVVPRKEEAEEERKRKEKQQAEMELKKAKEEKFEFEEDMKQNMEEEVEQKEDLEKKYTCFNDELETFWTRRDEEKQKEEEQGKEHSYFDELERFMNS